MSLAPLDGDGECSIELDTLSLSYSVALKAIQSLKAFVCEVGCGSSSFKILFVLLSNWNNAGGKQALASPDVVMLC